jgi:hypothetical protein
MLFQRRPKDVRLLFLLAWDPDAPKSSYCMLELHEWRVASSSCRDGDRELDSLRVVCAVGRGPSDGDGRTDMEGHRGKQENQR